MPKLKMKNNKAHGLKLPKDVVMEGNKFRLEGYISCHDTLEQALKQKEGIINERKNRE